MHIETIQTPGATIALLQSTQPILTDLQSALDLLATVGYQTESNRIAIYKEAITEDFFDLSTRLAGEILQKFINYGIKLAIIGDFSAYTSNALKSFLYESNRGNAIFFAATRQEAIQRLSGVHDSPR